MNTDLKLAHGCRWPTTAFLLAIACLLSTAAHAQRPSIAALQSQIAALQANNVPGLASYVSVDTSTPGQPEVTITAANLKVVNGTGMTSAVNGVGNVIVGYDEARTGTALCSLGQYLDQPTCTGGGTWAVSFKSGSHNVVIGAQHAYSRWGGLVAGERNVINGARASVLGGYTNIASGGYASVSGGHSNTASGPYASVSGGGSNAALGTDTTVSGGGSNTASGLYASVSGGIGNTAPASYASVSGGNNNTASDLYTSVSGGIGNNASNNYASVSGGNGVTLGTVYGWQGGSLHSP